MTLKLITAGAVLRCSFGAAATQLQLAGTPFSAQRRTLATIDDVRPGANIAGFGMCHAPTNPAVVAATSAANGVPTPAPCQPAIAGGWTPGSTVVDVDGVAAVPDNAQCHCQHMGVITVVAQPNDPISA